jgi:hypothetical protein
LNRRYQRTATTITSGGNRNPANADFGGNHGRGRPDDFTAQACLDHANAQRNGAAPAADVSEAHRVLGFKPLVGLDEGLRGYLDWINLPGSTPLWPYPVVPQEETLHASLARVIPPGWSKR